MFIKILFASYVAILTGAEEISDFFGLRLDPPSSLNLQDGHDDNSAKEAIQKVSQTLSTAARVALPIVSPNLIDSISDKIRKKAFDLVDEVRETEWVNVFGLPCDPNKSRLCHRKDETSSDEADDVDDFLPFFPGRRRKSDAAAEHVDNLREKEEGLQTMATRAEELAQEMERQFQTEHSAYKILRQIHSEEDRLFQQLQPNLRGGSRPVSTQFDWSAGVAPRKYLSPPTGLTAWRQLQAYNAAHGNVIHVSPLLPGATLHPESAAATRAHQMQAVIVSPSQLNMLKEATEEASRLTEALTADLDPLEVWAELPEAPDDVPAEALYSEVLNEEEEDGEYGEVEPLQRQDAQDFDAVFATSMPDENFEQ